MSDTLTLAPVSMPRTHRLASQITLLSPAALFGAVVAVLTSAAYLATVAPDLYSLDSPELAAAAYRLGIAHEPGYPLYTLAGWLFSHAFLVGNVAFRLNLLSSVFAVAAALATYGLALRLTSRPAIAAAGALALAFSYYFWAEALAAEVYSLDAALFAGILLAAYAWRARPTRGRAALAGLLLGLALATRTTSLLYLPALLGFAWVSGERSPKAYAAAAGGLAAGLLFYLYLPLRSATGADVGMGTYAADGTLRVHNLASVPGFISHVSASTFRGDAFAYGPVGMLKETGVFTTRLAAGFLFAGLPLGIAGIVRQWRTDRGLLLLIAGMAAPLTVFFINYGAPDKEFMFLPAYVAWALWMVIGMEWIAEGAALPAASPWAAAALALPLLALAVNFGLVSLHGERRPRTDAERVFASVPEGAIVYGSFQDTAPLQYLQAVEGERRDLRIVNGWTVDSGFLLTLARANVGKTPLFVIQDEPSLRREYRLVKTGAAYEVRAPAQ